MEEPRNCSGTSDQELLEQERALREMVEKNRLLLESIKMDERDVEDSLTDRTRYTPEAWASLQQHRELLEKAIEERIQAAKEPKKPTQTKPLDIQGHWIFVR